MGLKIKKSVSIDDIIKGCRRGNSRAQAELFERFSARLLGVCRRYVGDLAEAEDIMIGGFMKIFDKINQFKGEGSFEGWMIRIIVNESLTYIRKNKSMSVEVSIEKADREPDYDVVYNNYDSDKLLKLVDELPIGYRTVFNLYVLEGYAHKEIAELLGISTNASKSQLSRARAQLRHKVLMLEKTLKKENHGKKQS